MTKIEALRKTVSNLEKNVYRYDWFDLNRCNVGILAKTILNGKDAIDAGLYDSPYKALDPYLGAFGRYTYCLTTNLPLPEVFSALKDSEFTHDELCKFEFLADPQIRKRAKLIEGGQQGDLTTARCFYKKDILIAYLKAWIELLEEEAVNEKPPFKETIRYVSVPESLTRITRERVLEADTTN